MRPSGVEADIDIDESKAGYVGHIVFLFVAAAMSTRKSTAIGHKSSNVACKQTPILTHRGP